MRGIGAITWQESGPIDVHMVTQEQAAGQRRARRARTRLPRRRTLAGWVLAALLPGLVTLAGVLLRGHLFQATDAVAFVLVTVVVAIAGGREPALAAAALSGLLYDIFFTHPYYRLTIDEPQNVVALVVMMTVAVLVSLVVDRAARRAEQAARARTEASLLASYARTVLTHPQPLPTLLEQVRENFALASVALLEQREGRWERVASAGPSPCEQPGEADVDVPVTPQVHLALRGRALPAADRRAVEAAAGQALLALRQQRMAAHAAEAQRRAEATKLRTALLSALGHDLRTPLTSIKAAIGCLRDPGVALSGEDTAELLATIELSTDRLAGLVANLLDSSRLATGAVAPRFAPVGYEEVVAKALAGMPEAGLVEVDVDEQLPPVRADPGLLERVVANLVDNALRHGCAVPPGEGLAGRDGEPAVAVRASGHGGNVELRVVDHGPGLPAGAVAAVFTPFQRFGDRSAPDGLGLGLSVAKGFMEAMGGELRAEDTPGGGLTMVICLPAYRS